MHYGIVVPSEIPPETIVELGVSSERTGWDGMFVWDTLLNIVTIGNTFGSDPLEAAARTRKLADAGSTWWIEDVWTSADDLPRLRQRIESGPPHHA